MLKTLQSEVWNTYILKTATEMYITLVNKVTLVRIDSRHGLCNT